MSSWLIPTCTLCGLRFSNNALLELHIREDHLERNRSAEQHHDDPGDNGNSRLRAGGSAASDVLVPSQARTDDEVNTRTAALPARPGPVMTAVRRAIGVIRYVNDELLRAGEAMIRSARAPQPDRRSVRPAGKDAQAASTAKRGDLAALCRRQVNSGSRIHLPPSYAGIVFCLAPGEMRREAMLTVEFTAEEARAVAEVIVAWGADDCPVGPIDTEALRIASDKLTAAIDTKCEWRANFAPAPDWGEPVFR